MTISSYIITCYLGEELTPSSLSGGCRQLRGPPWASSSPLNSAGPSTSHRTCVPSTSPTPMSFSGLTPAAQWLSCCEKPRFWYKSQGVASLVMSTEENHCPSPAGHVIAAASKPYFWPAPPGPFSWVTFQTLIPKQVVLHGLVAAQEQDQELPFAPPHTIDFGPSTQPVQMQNLPALQKNKTPFSLLS